MMKLRFVAAIVLACAFAAAALTIAAETDVSDLLEKIRAEHKQPGIAAAVVNSQQVLASGCSGKRQNGEEAAITIEDRFHIGSCTKSMTATVLGMLVHDGKLKWESTLTEMFPELTDAMHETYRSVTLKQLLTHCGGVPAFTSGNAPEVALSRGLEGSQTEQRLEFLKRVVKQQPVHQPGKRKMYSNGGYGLAAAMAEKATGKSWEDLLRERLFGPLDMKSAGFGWPATSENPKQPRGHHRNGAAHWPNENYTLPPALAPAGDVHCTIRDFAKYAQFHLRGLRGEETKLLSAEEFKMLHTVGLEDYAMGWVRRPRKSGGFTSWHNGSAGTFFAWMTIYPDDNLAIVVCTNSGSGEPACKDATEELREHEGLRAQEHKGTK